MNLSRGEKSEVDKGKENERERDLWDLNCYKPWKRQAGHIEIIT